jgi:outer membrane protein OmpA-like peptidoglycan-associated protein
MSFVGWGQEKPVSDNRSEEGRAKNRRVEIVKK